MANDQCAIHGHEPIPEKYFRICGECWHVFVTAEELVQAYRDEMPEPKRPTPLEEIYFCPYCTHDF